MVGDFKAEVIKLLSVTGIDKAEIARLVEKPKDHKMGDYAFPCFTLSKQMKKAPQAIAAEIASQIKPSGAISEVRAAGPYINFFIDKNKLAEKLLPEIILKGLTYGSHSGRNEKVLIEYPAPNTNKPLHLGHARNMLLGSSLCNILAFAGLTAIPVNLVNDRGVHICKSMLAYQKWGNNEEPNKKSDHFVGDYYVLFSQRAEQNPGLEQEALAMLSRWEQGDPEVVELWRKMRKWALDGHDKTYADFNVHHKKVYYESDLYKHGKDIILDGLNKGLFHKDETGAVYVDLGDLGKKVLLRADGTSIYITQDIYLAKVKFDDFKMDRSIHVVGSEQAHHFKVLFKILELLKYPFAQKCYHLSYGMIYLPEGKMKSREGTVVDSDDLTSEMLKIAKTEISKRHHLSHEELERRAKMISMGALKFFFLKYDALKDFTYNPEESISFEGETGPYVQYAHARINSILRQVKDHNPKEKKYHFKHEKEHRLLTLLSEYPSHVLEAAEKYNPSIIARYAYELAQAFNEFYSECPVLKSENADDRLALIWCIATVVRSALDLLGIRAPEEM